MDELVQILMQKTGISQEKAQEVVNTVVNHLKARLPAPIASHLDTILSGTNSGELSAIEDKAKSMMLDSAAYLARKNKSILLAEKPFLDSLMRYQISFYEVTQ